MMRYHAKDGLRVVPVLMRTFSMENAPYAMLTGLPRDGKFIGSVGDKDGAWMGVVRGVTDVVRIVAKSLNG